MLKSGRIEEPLEKMDRCRIRWGQVQSVEGDSVTVKYRPLTFDGVNLLLGSPETEQVTRAMHGRTFITDLAAGDWVSMHWHWVCDRLDRRQLANLRRYSQHQLDITNRGVAHSGPGVMMSG